jgi:hypothetical protein
MDFIQNGNISPDILLCYTRVKVRRTRVIMYNLIKNIKVKDSKMSRDIKKGDSFFSCRDEGFVGLTLNFSRGKFFYVQNVM